MYVYTYVCRDREREILFICFIVSIITNLCCPCEKIKNYIIKKSSI